jgi:peptidoglycan/LPS O-acetylase OafA/YrhL
MVWNSSFLARRPSLFILTKNSKIDYYLGWYCYPIYLWHFVAYEIANKYFSDLQHFKLISFVFILFCSFLIVHFIEIPLETIRKKISVG